MGLPYIFVDFGREQSWPRVRILALLGQGDVFGDSQWKRNKLAKSAVHVRALTYCDIHMITVDKLKEVMEFYKVRRKQVTVSLTQILVITFSYFSLNFPLFRCTQTTSAPQKLTLAAGQFLLQTPSWLLPSSHPARRPNSYFARSLLLAAPPT